jgi:hypothetical protein
VPDVRPGQTWADNDRRAAGRTVRVERVDDWYAHVVVVTNAAGAAQSTSGREHRILLSRMRPTSSGYRLIQDMPEVPDA